MPDSNFHTKTPPKLWAEGECLSNYSFFHFLAKLIQIFSHLYALFIIKALQFVLLFLYPFIVWVGTVIFYALLT